MDPRPRFPPRHFIGPPSPRGSRFPPNQTTSRIRMPPPGLYPSAHRMHEINDDASSDVPSTSGAPLPAAVNPYERSGHLDSRASQIEVKKCVSRYFPFLGRRLSSVPGNEARTATHFSQTQFPKVYSRYKEAGTTTTPTDNTPTTPTVKTPTVNTPSDVYPKSITAPWSFSPTLTTTPWGLIPTIANTPWGLSPAIVTANPGFGPNISTIPSSFQSCQATSPGVQSFTLPSGQTVIVASSAATNNPGITFTNTPGVTAANMPGVTVTNIPGVSAANTSGVTVMNTPGVTTTNTPGVTMMLLPSGQIVAGNTVAPTPNLQFMQSASAGMPFNCPSPVMVLTTPRDQTPSASPGMPFLYPSPVVILNTPNNQTTPETSPGQKEFASDHQHEVVTESLEVESGTRLVKKREASLWLKDNPDPTKREDAEEELDRMLSKGARSSQCRSTSTSQTRSNSPPIMKIYYTRSRSPSPQSRRTCSPASPVWTRRSPPTFRRPDPSADTIEEYDVVVDGMSGHEASITAAAERLAPDGTRLVLKREASIWLRDREDGSPPDVQNVEYELKRLLNTGIQTDSYEQGDRKPESRFRKSRERRSRLANRTVMALEQELHREFAQQKEKNDVFDDSRLEELDSADGSGEENFDDEVRLAVDKIMTLTKRHKQIRPKQERNKAKSTTPPAVETGIQTRLFSPPPTPSPEPEPRCDTQKVAEAVKAIELQTQICCLQQSLANMLQCKAGVQENVDVLLKSKGSLQRGLNELKNELRNHRESMRQKDDSSSQTERDKPASLPACWKISSESSREIPERPYSPSPKESTTLEGVRQTEKCSINLNNVSRDHNMDFHCIRYRMGDCEHNSEETTTNQMVDAVVSQGFEECSVCARPHGLCICGQCSENNNSDRRPDEEAYCSKCLRELSKVNKHFPSQLGSNTAEKSGITQWRATPRSDALNKPEDYKTPVPSFACEETSKRTILPHSFKRDSTSGISEERRHHWEQQSFVKKNDACPTQPEDAKGALKLDSLAEKNVHKGKKKKSVGTQFTVEERSPPLFSGSNKGKHFKKECVELDIPIKVLGRENTEKAHPLSKEKYSCLHEDNCICSKCKGNLQESYQIYFNSKTNLVPQNLQAPKYFSESEEDPSHDVESAFGKNSPPRQRRRAYYTFSGYPDRPPVCLRRPDRNNTNARSGRQSSTWEAPRAISRQPQSGPWGSHLSTRNIVSPIRSPAQVRDFSGYTPRAKDSIQEYYKELENERINEDRWQYERQSLHVETFPAVNSPDWDSSAEDSPCLTMRKDYTKTTPPPVSDNRFRGRREGTGLQLEPRRQQSPGSRQRDVSPVSNFRRPRLMTENLFFRNEGSWDIYTALGKRLPQPLRCEELIAQERLLAGSDQAQWSIPAYCRASGGYVDRRRAARVSPSYQRRGMTNFPANYTTGLFERDTLMNKDARIVRSERTLFMDRYPWTREKIAVHEDSYFADDDSWQESQAEQSLQVPRSEVKLNIRSASSSPCMTNIHHSVSVYSSPTVIDVTVSSESQGSATVSVSDVVDNTSRAIQVQTISSRNEISLQPLNKDHVKFQQVSQHSMTLQQAYPESADSGQCESAEMPALFVKVMIMTDKMNSKAVQTASEKADRMIEEKERKLSDHECICWNSDCQMQTAGDVTVSQSFSQKYISQKSEHCLQSSLKQSISIADQTQSPVKEVSTEIETRIKRTAEPEARTPCSVKSDVGHAATVQEQMGKLISSNQFRNELTVEGEPECSGSKQDAISTYYVNQTLKRALTGSSIQKSTLNSFCSVSYAGTVEGTEFTSAPRTSFVSNVQLNTAHQVQPMPSESISVPPSSRVNNVNTETKGMIDYLDPIDDKDLCLRETPQQISSKKTSVIDYLDPIDDKDLCLRETPQQISSKKTSVIDYLDPIDDKDLCLRETPQQISSKKTSVSFSENSSPLHEHTNPVLTNISLPPGTVLKTPGSGRTMAILNPLSTKGKLKTLSADNLSQHDSLMKHRFLNPQCTFDETCDRSDSLLMIPSNSSVRSRRDSISLTRLRKQRILSLPSDPKSVQTGGKLTSAPACSVSMPQPFSPHQPDKQCSLPHATGQLQQNVPLLSLSGPKQQNSTPTVTPSSQSSPSQDSSISTKSSRRKKRPFKRTVKRRQPKRVLRPQPNRCIIHNSPASKQVFRPKTTLRISNYVCLSPSTTGGIGSSIQKKVTGSGSSSDENTQSQNSAHNNSLSARKIVHCGVLTREPSGSSLKSKTKKRKSNRTSVSRSQPPPPLPAIAGCSLENVTQQDEKNHSSTEHLCLFVTSDDCADIRNCENNSCPLQKKQMKQIIQKICDTPSDNLSYNNKPNGQDVLKVTVNCKDDSSTPSPTEPGNLPTGERKRCADGANASKDGSTGHSCALPPGFQRERIQSYPGDFSNSRGKVQFEQTAYCMHNAESTSSGRKPTREAQQSRNVVCCGAELVPRAADTRSVQRAFQLELLRLQHGKKTEKLSQKIHCLKEKQRNLIATLKKDCLDIVESEVRAKDVQLLEERNAKARLKDAIVCLQKQLMEMEREMWQTLLSKETSQQAVNRDKQELENKIGLVQVESSFLKAEKRELATKLEKIQDAKEDLEEKLAEARFSSREKEIISQHQEEEVSIFKTLATLSHDKYQEQRDIAAKLQTQLVDLTKRLEERNKEADALRKQLEVAKTVVIKSRRQVEQLKMLQIELRTTCQKEQSLSEAAMKEKKAVEDKLHLETARYSSLLAQVDMQGKRLMSVRAKVESLDPSRLRHQFEIRYRSQIDLVMRQVSDILEQRTAATEAAEMSQQEMNFWLRAQEGKAQMLDQRNQQMNAMKSAIAEEASFWKNICSTRCCTFGQNSQIGVPNVECSGPNMASPLSPTIDGYFVGLPEAACDVDNFLPCQHAQQDSDKFSCTSSFVEQQVPTQQKQFSEKDMLDIRLRALKLKVGATGAVKGKGLSQPRYCHPRIRAFKAESKSYLASVRYYPASEFAPTPPSGVATKSDNWVKVPLTSNSYVSASSGTESLVPPITVMNASYGEVPTVDDMQELSYSNQSPSDCSPLEEIGCVNDLSTNYIFPTSSQRFIWREPEMPPTQNRGTHGHKHVTRSLRNKPKRFWEERHTKNQKIQSEPPIACCCQARANHTARNYGRKPIRRFPSKGPEIGTCQQQPCCTTFPALHREAKYQTCPFSSSPLRSTGNYGMRSDFTQTSHSCFSLCDSFTSFCQDSFMSSDYQVPNGTRQRQPGQGSSPLKIGLSPPRSSQKMYVPERMCDLIHTSRVCISSSDSLVSLTTESFSQISDFDWHVEQSEHLLMQPSQTFCKSRNHRCQTPVCFTSTNRKKLTTACTQTSRTCHSFSDLWLQPKTASFMSESNIKPCRCRRWHRTNICPPRNMTCLRQFVQCPCFSQTCQHKQSVQCRCCSHICGCSNKAESDFRRISQSCCGCSKFSSKECFKSTSYVLENEMCRHDCIQPASKCSLPHRRFCQVLQTRCCQKSRLPCCCCAHDCCVGSLQNDNFILVSGGFIPAKSCKGCGRHSARKTESFQTHHERGTSLQENGPVHLRSHFSQTSYSCDSFSDSIVSSNDTGSLTCIHSQNRTVERYRSERYPELEKTMVKGQGRIIPSRKSFAASVQTEGEGEFSTIIQRNVMVYNRDQSKKSRREELSLSDVRMESTRPVLLKSAATTQISCMRSVGVTFHSEQDCPLANSVGKFGSRSQKNTSLRRKEIASGTQTGYQRWFSEFQETVAVQTSDIFAPDIHDSGLYLRLASQHGTQTTRQATEQAVLRNVKLSGAAKRNRTLATTSVIDAIRSISYTGQGTQTSTSLLSLIQEIQSDVQLPKYQNVIGTQTTSLRTWSLENQQVFCGRRIMSTQTHPSLMDLVQDCAERDITMVSVGQIQSETNLRHNEVLMNDPTSPNKVGNVTFQIDKKDSITCFNKKQASRTPKKDRRNTPGPSPCQWDSSVDISGSSVDLQETPQTVGREPSMSSDHEESTGFERSTLSFKKTVAISEKKRENIADENNISCCAKTHRNTQSSSHTSCSLPDSKFSESRNEFYSGNTSDLYGRRLRPSDQSDIGHQIALDLGLWDMLESIERRVHQITRDANLNLQSLRRQNGGETLTSPTEGGESASVRRSPLPDAIQSGSGGFPLTPDWYTTLSTCTDQCAAQSDGRIRRQFINRRVSQSGDIGDAGNFSSLPNIQNSNQFQSGISQIFQNGNSAQSGFGDRPTLRNCSSTLAASKHPLLYGDYDNLEMREGDTSYRCVNDFNNDIVSKLAETSTVVASKSAERVTLKKHSPPGLQSPISHQFPQNIVPKPNISHTHVSSASGVLPIAEMQPRSILPMSGMQQITGQSSASAVVDQRTSDITTLQSAQTLVNSTASKSYSKQFQVLPTEHAMQISTPTHSHQPTAAKSQGYSTKRKKSQTTITATETCSHLTQPQTLQETPRCSSFPDPNHGFVSRDHTTRQTLSQITFNAEEVHSQSKHQQSVPQGNAPSLSPGSPDYKTKQTFSQTTLISNAQGCSNKTPSLPPQTVARSTTPPPAYPYSGSMSPASHSVRKSLCSCTAPECTCPISSPYIPCTLSVNLPYNQPTVSTLSPEVNIALQQAALPPSHFSQVHFLTDPPAFRGAPASVSSECFSCNFISFPYQAASIPRDSMAHPNLPCQAPPCPIQVNTSPVPLASNGWYVADSTVPLSTVHQNSTLPPFHMENGFPGKGKGKSKHTKSMGSTCRHDQIKSEKSQNMKGEHSSKRVGVTEQGDPVSEGVSSWIPNFLQAISPPSNRKQNKNKRSESSSGQDSTGSEQNVRLSNDGQPDPFIL